MAIIICEYSNHTQTNQIHNKAGAAFTLKMKTVQVIFLLFFSTLLVYFSNAQTCTSPVYNNSAGVTIRGPCPSSQVIAPIGSTIKFECSYSYTVNDFTVWNITDIPLIVGPNVPLNTSIIVTVQGSSDGGYTTLTLPLTKQVSVDVQCGLFNPCINPLQPTVISLPVQLISFGK